MTPVEQILILATIVFFTIIAAYDLDLFLVTSMVWILLVLAIGVSNGYV